MLSPRAPSTSPPSPSSSSTTWPRSTSSCARPAAGSPRSTGATARPAATRWPATACSTRPCSASSARSVRTATGARNAGGPGHWAEPRGRLRRARGRHRPRPQLTPTSCTSGAGPAGPSARPLTHAARRPPRQEDRSGEQRGEVEPAVAAGGAARRVADRQPADRVHRCHDPGAELGAGSSSQVTTTPAPTYTSGDGPQRRNPSRQTNQTAPRASAGPRAGDRAPPTARAAPSPAPRRRAGGAARTGGAPARRRRGRPGRAPAARTPARCRSGRGRPPAPGRTCTPPPSRRRRRPTSGHARTASIGAAPRAAPAQVAAPEQPLRRHGCRRCRARSTTLSHPIIRRDAVAPSRVPGASPAHPASRLSTA